MFTWLRRSSFISLSLLFAVLAYAEPNWILTPTPTNQDLWGVTWTNGQFITVGQAGTILTSPDGITWTNRTSGTDAWLLAVSYAPHLQRYVVVGAGGTILTSPDATTWSRVSSGTTERLNGVAVGGGRVVVVGENSTVLSSTDGSTWTVAKVGTPGWLRAIAYVDGQFLIGGKAIEGAPKMPTYTTADGITFSELAGSPFGTTTEAMYTDGNEVAVLSWFVGVSPARMPLTVERVYDPNPDFIVIWDYSRGVVLFDGWYFVAADRGTIFGAPRYGSLWFGGINKFGDTTFTAMSANEQTALAVGSGGTIVRLERKPRGPSVSIANTQAFTTPVSSLAAGAKLELNASADGTFPLTFQWLHNEQPISGATGRTLTIPAVGPEHTGAYTAVVTNALGSVTANSIHVQVLSPLQSIAPVDPTFAPARAVSQPVQTSDGKLLVITRPGDATAPSEVIRLHPDGSLDRSFSPHPATRVRLLDDGRILAFGTDVRRLQADGRLDETFTPIASGNALLEPLADGRILSVSVSQNRLTLRRYQASGLADTDYAPADFVLADPSTGLFGPNYSTLLAARVPDGLLVGTSSRSSAGTGNYGRNSTMLLRLKNDGAVISGPHEIRRNIVQLVSTERGLYYLAVDGTGMAGFAHGVGRITHSLQADPAYTGQSLYLGSDYGVSVALGNDGSFAVVRDAWAYETGPYQLLVYDAAGSRIAPLQARLTARGDASWMPDGSLYLSGEFTELNGAPRAGLARLQTRLQERATRLANVSVRQRAAEGSETLTLGLSIAGTGSKELLVRGLGPALLPFGIGNALPNPRLTLWDSLPSIRAENDDWATAQREQIAGHVARMGALSLPADSRDAATLTSLTSGTYTVQITGGTGVALAEAYDLDRPANDDASARLVNFSARAFAGAGDETLILGFTVLGPGTKRVLVRGVGPSLSAYGVSGVLADPVITVYQGNRAVAWANDERSAGADQIGGPFPLTNGRDPALLLDLPAGTYTVQASSADGGTGVALLEVYEVR